MLDHCTTQIASLNDRGAALLLEGKHKDAIDLFRHCSCIMKSCLAIHEADSCLSSSPRSPPQAQPPRANKNRKPTQFFTSGVMTSLQEREFFICNRPFLLESVLANTEGSSPASFGATMRLCSAASVYNMALSFHQRAMEGNSQARECAEMLYLSTLELLMTNDNDGHVISCGDEVFLLAISAANNVSHLRILNEGPSSERATASLRLLQSCILPTLTRGVRLSCVSQTEWESICRNMHAQSRLTSTISAAAA